jgi:hypothetical protein
MVNLIKTGLDGVRTLAIGDGANDVAMIQAAHIGVITLRRCGLWRGEKPLTFYGVCVQVGIKGEEGLQAVNSSDYAIAQFRFLSDLLLKHGRYNYIRMSNSVCYIFYKNILMSITQFWFNFSCAFSGQKYYTEGAIQLYNFLYSNLPLLMLGIYDTDIAPASAHKYPQIYLSGINDDYFKVRFCIFVLVLLFKPVCALRLYTPLIASDWPPNRICPQYVTYPPVLRPPTLAAGVLGLDRHRDGGVHVHLRAAAVHAGQLLAQDRGRRVLPHGRHDRLHRHRAGRQLQGRRAVTVCPWGGFGFPAISWIASHRELSTRSNVFVPAFPLPPSQLFFVQSKWYHFSILLVVLSIASYFATVSFITSFMSLDYDFYHVSHCCR